MSDRRMTERRDDGRDEAAAEGDRRGGGEERRMIERFTSKSVNENVEQLRFWLQVAFIVLVAFGVYNLVEAFAMGTAHAGPGILNSVLIFTTAFFVNAPRRWAAAYRKNESLANFENMFERVMGLLRYGSFLAALYLVIFIAKKI